MVHGEALHGNVNEMEVEFAMVPTSTFTLVFDYHLYIGLYTIYILYNVIIYAPHLHEPPDVPNVT